MGDYGIKVSRATFPASTAADNQLLFSSAFPSLLILFSGALDNGATFTHNLGYIPCFMTVDQGVIQEQALNDNGENFNGIRADTTKLYNNSGVGIIYFIYNREIRTNLSGTNINLTPADAITPNQDYGFKVSKEGSSVETATVGDLTSFSGLSLAGQAIKQLIVHQSGYQDNLSNGSTYTYSHNLGYAPMCWVWIRKNGTTPYYLMSSTITINGDLTISTPYIANIDASNLSIVANPGFNIDIGYIIFKDPF